MRSCREAPGTGRSCSVTEGDGDMEVLTCCVGRTVRAALQDHEARCSQSVTVVERQRLQKLIRRLDSEWNAYDDDEFREFSSVRWRDLFLSEI